MLLNRIKERGKEFDMSLQDIANATNISPNTIYSWRIKTPRTDKLKEVAKVLHTTTDYLNGLTDDPSIPESNSSITDTDLDEMLDNARSFDGKPMTDHDRELIRSYLKVFVRCFYTY